MALVEFLGDFPRGSLDATGFFSDSVFEKWVEHLAVAGNTGSSFEQLFKSIMESPVGLKVSDDHVEVLEHPLLKIDTAAFSVTDHAVLSRMKERNMFHRVAKIISSQKTIYSGFKVPIEVDRKEVVLRLAIFLIRRAEKAAQAQTAASVVFALGRCGLNDLKSAVLGTFTAAPNSAADGALKSPCCTFCHGVVDRPKAFSFQATTQHVEGYVRAVMEMVPNLLEVLGAEVADTVPFPVRALMVYGVLYDHVFARQGERKSHADSPPVLQALLGKFWMGHDVPKGHERGVFWHSGPLDRSKICLAIADEVPDAEAPVSPVPFVGLKVKHFPDKVPLQSQRGIAFCHPTPLMFGGSVGFLTREQRGYQLSVILEHLFAKQLRIRKSRADGNRPLYRLVAEVLNYGDLAIATRVIRHWVGPDRVAQRNRDWEKGTLPSRVLNRECWKELFRLIECMMDMWTSRFSHLAIQLIHAFVVPYGPVYWVGKEARSGQSADKFITELLLASTSPEHAVLETLLSLRQSDISVSNFEHKLASKPGFEVRTDDDLGDIPVMESEIEPDIWALFYAENGPWASGIRDPGELGFCSVSKRVVDIKRVFITAQRLAKPPFVPPKLQSVRKPFDCACGRDSFPTSAEVQAALKREEARAQRAQEKADREREARRTQKELAHEKVARNWANSSEFAEADRDDLRSKVSQINWGKKKD